MSNTADMRPVLDFLDELRQHNNKAWFDAHRAGYEQAKANFEAFVERLIADLGKIEDLKGVTARDCVMRIYRDVRFSKDKSPYKTNMGASIAPGGKKSSRLGYYIHVAPRGETMVAGGLHMPEAAALARFRAAIDRDARPFKKLIARPQFKRTFGELSGERLKTAPQGYDRDHPEIELLRLKEVAVFHSIPDDVALSARFPRHMFEACQALKPFLDYLNGVLQ